MEPADIIIMHKRAGETVTVPADLTDEQLWDWLEDNDVRTYSVCSVDNSFVDIGEHGRQARCRRGEHRWLYVAADPAVPGSVPGWRQVP